MTCCLYWNSDASWKYFGSTSPTNISKRYQSPVQGSSWLDCTFIAALSSVTWINPKFFKDVSTQNPPYRYFFWDEGTATKVEVQINSNLLVVNPGSTSFCGAVSSQFASTKEVWPALYEKAYAKFCLYKKNPGKMSTDNLKDPAYWPLFNAAGEYNDWYNPCSLTDVQWGGNPVTVMARLTGCTAQPRIMYEKDTDGCPDRTQPNFPDIYDYIRTNFCMEADATNKTRNAMAAWTYIDEVCVNSKRFIPNDCHYTLNGIQKNHCYSILGVFDAEGINYIVLRDPCGIDPLNANIIPKKYTGSTNWQYGNKFFTLCNSQISFGLITQIGTPANPTVSLSFGDGIFALKASEFGNYFEGFGWVQS
jgi:hypothetical protein